MKKTFDVFHIIGLAMLTVYLIVNRFVVDIPDYIAFPYLIIAIVILIFSIARRKKSCAPKSDNE